MWEKSDNSGERSFGRHKVGWNVLVSLWQIGAINDPVEGSSTYLNHIPNNTPLPPCLAAIILVLVLVLYVQHKACEPNLT